jgi:hypothetical protein
MSRIDYNEEPTLDQELLANLVAKREELGAVIYGLEVSMPSAILPLRIAALTIFFLVISVILAVAPYFDFHLNIPSIVSTAATFLVVFLLFGSYLAVRKASFEYERLRMYSIVRQRAIYVGRIADSLFEDVHRAQLPMKEE